MDGRIGRLERGLALLLAVIAGGTAWYWLIEDFPPMDALYMAVTTMTTVGFREVHPLDTSGRLFTIGFIFVGAGIAFYTVVAMAEAMLVGEIREALGISRRSRRVHRMDGHYVLCGFGRVGQEIAEELAERRVPFVIVDREAAQQARAHERGYLSVLGDATDEAVLREAGVERARVLIAAADSDVGNTFVTLTARALNPRLSIIARAASEAGEQRMRTAGADRVISPYQIAGRRMALAAVRPALIDFAEALSVRRPGEANLLAEIVVGPGGLPEQTVGALSGALRASRVLGVEHADGEVVVGPAAETMLRAGDRLMVYGAQHEIEALCAGGEWLPGGSPARAGV